MKYENEVLCIESPFTRSVYVNPFDRSRGVGPRSAVKKRKLGIKDAAISEPNAWLAAAQSLPKPKECIRSVGTYMVS